MHASVLLPLARLKPAAAATRARPARARLNALTGTAQLSSSRAARPNKKCPASALETLDHLICPCRSFTRAATPRAPQPNTVRARAPTARR